MRQVRRQNKERFEQTERQHRNYDEGNQAKNLTDGPGHDQKRRERSDRRQDGEGHWRRHLLGAENRRALRCHALFGFCVDILAHYDGVIDHHTQSDDQGEQRDHVDRQAERLHQ